MTSTARPSPVRQAQARMASAIRYQRPAAEIAAARAEYDREVLKADIRAVLIKHGNLLREIAASAPPLSEDQLSRLWLLMDADGAE